MNLSKLSSLVKSYSTIVFSKRDIQKNIYSLQKYNIPDVSRGTTIVKFHGIETKFEGDSLQYGMLNLSFICDEYLNNYSDMYDWMHSGKKYKSTNVYEQNITARILNYRPDGDLLKLRSVIEIRNIKPINIGNLDYDSSNEETPYAPFDMAFDVEFFEVLNKVDIFPTW